MKISDKYEIHLSWKHGLKGSKVKLMAALRDLLEIPMDAVVYMFAATEKDGWLTLAMPDCEMFKTLVFDSYEVTEVKKALCPLVEVRVENLSRNIYGFGNNGYGRRTPALA